jgi:hypothetical protein
MTGTPTTPTPAAAPSLDDLKITPRETAQWELALGLPLSQFPESYSSALAAWKMAKDAGRPITVDEALDTDWGTIAALAGVNPTPPPIRSSKRGPAKTA